MGELVDYEDGIAIKLTFGKPLKRILKPLMGQKLEVGFKVLKYQRSQAQNKWLWGVAYITIASWYKDTNGYTITKDAIHAHTLQEILDYKIRTGEINGKEVIYIDGKSTSALSVKEFSEMKDKLQVYWAERGCYIPDPRGNNFLSDYLDDE